MSLNVIPPDPSTSQVLLVVGVFGPMAVLVTWLQAKDGTQNFSDILKEQTLHWLSTLIVIGGAFLLEQANRIDQFSASLVILLILSLATILDGIRIGWQLSVVGFFLGACAILIAFTEEFMLVACLLAAAIITCTILWEIWMHKRLYQ